MECAKKKSPLDKIHMSSGSEKFCFWEASLAHFGLAYILCSSVVQCDQSMLPFTKVGGGDKSKNGTHHDFDLHFYIELDNVVLNLVKAEPQLGHV